MSAQAAEIVAAALALPAPLAIDADALNLIAGDARLGAALAARSAPTALTPHPAEAARLAGTQTSAVQADRLQCALDLAARSKASVVLKGAGSVLAFADGSWAINASGNPALASGGTGDALSGMLGAFLAQGVPMKQALELAVSFAAPPPMHWSPTASALSVTASELAPVAHDCLTHLRGSRPTVSEVACWRSRRRWPRAASC
jgi:hydroxyethylthiazole kinase-like uncharacterized protein yjeF